MTLALLSDPREWLLLVAALSFLCSACVFLLACAIYRASMRREKRYPAFSPPSTESPDPLRVIGGNGVPSEDRWAA